MVDCRKPVDTLTAALEARLATLGGTPTIQISQFSGLV